MSSMIVRKITTKKAKPVSTVRVTEVVDLKKRGKSRRKHSRTGKAKGNNNIVSAYLNMMNKPFDCAPVRAGFGTFVPTELYAAYDRGNVAIASNTFGGIVVVPALTSSIITYNGNTSSTFLMPTGYDFANAPAIRSTCSQARVIAMGLRVFPLIAATTTPYMAYCGLSPSPGSAAAMNTFIGASNATYFRNLASSQIHMCDGTKPIEVLWRPEDVSDFEFTRDTMNAGGSTSDFGPFCYVFLDAPTGTSFYYETVMILEGTQSVTSGANTTDEASAASTHPSVAGEANLTLESFMNTVQGGLASSSKLLKDWEIDTSTIIKGAKTAHTIYKVVKGQPIDDGFVHVKDR